MVQSHGYAARRYLASSNNISNGDYRFGKVTHISSISKILQFSMQFPFLIIALDDKCWWCSQTPAHIPSVEMQISIIGLVQLPPDIVWDVFDNF